MNLRQTPYAMLSATHCQLLLSTPTEISLYASLPSGLNGQHMTLSLGLQCTYKAIGCHLDSTPTRDVTIEIPQSTHNTATRILYTELPQHLDNLQ